MKLRTLLTTLFAVALAVPAFAEPIKIGYSDWPGWTAWEIAKEKGFFKKRGVDVKLIWFPIYTDSLTALNTGKLDANCQTWSDTIPPLAEGIKLKVVLANDNSAGNDGLVSKKEFKSIKSLKGKSVATELGTVDHFLLLQALAKNGMTEKDIVYKNMTVPDAAAAFRQGKLDAAELIAANEGLGYRVLKFYRFVQTPKIFVYLILLGAVGLLLDFVFRKMNQRLFHWADTTKR